ncbi:hypothetical protein AGMMS49543_10490 [Betaproteobacteria bacterium]|nr:hypothetical protein AGMMS49543_10490 [Betaproteobacteria bacterium]
MNKTPFFLCALFLGLGSPAIHAQEEAVTFLRAESVPAPHNVEKARRAPLGRHVVVVPKRFVLAPNEPGLVERTVQARTKAKSDRAEGMLLAVPLQIGLGREVLALKSASDTRAQLDWQPQADGGHAAALALASPDAVAIRLGVRVFSLPDQAIVRVHAPGEDDAAVFEGSEISALIARNLAAGEQDEAAHVWWAPTVDGEEAVLEIVLPAGLAPERVEIAVPQISHLFASARTNWKAKSGDWQEKISCFNTDVNCQTGWDLQSRATAKMEFVIGGKPYVCTGTLLNDLDPTTTIPWFLSANHCISTQTAASSLETLWRWRNAACKSSTTDPKLTALYGGAELVYTSSNTDTSFMRLNEAAPDVAAYAGWSATLPGLHAQIAGVHHPDGEKQEIALGDVVGYASCTSVSGGGFNCTGTGASAASYIRTSWSNGFTQGGSSGSGLFDTTTQDKSLVGTLLGGDSYSACFGSEDVYGRFDLPFNAKLHEYLVPQSIPAGKIALRDAIYLYNQPLYGAASKIKTLVGYRCDVFQLLLDVQSGYTDLAMLENATANGSATTYPDHISSGNPMFSYMLYKAQPVKTFALSRYLDGTDSGQIGTATIFGYCFSSRTDAKVLLHNRETATCQLPNGQSRSCPTVPNTPPQ